MRYRDGSPHIQLAPWMTLSLRSELPEYFRGLQINEWLALAGADNISSAPGLDFFEKYGPQGLTNDQWADIGSIRKVAMGCYSKCLRFHRKHDAFFLRIVLVSFRPITMILGEHPIRGRIKGLFNRPSDSDVAAGVFDRLKPVKKFLVMETAPEKTLPSGGLISSFRVP
jgi:hypothetical protein